MQNHPKPDLKLILRPKEDFRDIFQPGFHVISPLGSHHHRSPCSPYVGRGGLGVDDALSI